MSVLQFMNEGAAIERALQEMTREYNHERAAVPNICLLKSPRLSDLVGKVVREELQTSTWAQITTLVVGRFNRPRRRPASYVVAGKSRDGATRRVAHFVRESF